VILADDGATMKDVGSAGQTKDVACLRGACWMTVLERVQTPADIAEMAK
jgi:hypothetical protein